MKDVCWGPLSHTWRRVAQMSFVLSRAHTPTACPKPPKKPSRLARPHWDSQILLTQKCCGQKEVWIPPSFSHPLPQALYLVVVVMAIDGEAVASDSTLVTGSPHIAPATHPHITACAHQLRGVFLHRLQAPGVWEGEGRGFCLPGPRVMGAPSGLML